MPGKSKAQQKAASAALAAKRGETSRAKLKGASKQMAQSMTEQELHELAATPQKRLPDRKLPKSERQTPCRLPCRNCTGTA